MPWIILVLAGLFEVGWAIGLKYTDGFTKLWPTVGTVAAMAISLGLLGIAMKSLPVGTAYAIWVGVGAVGTVILGIVLFNEPVNALRLVSVGLIVAGRNLIPPLRGDDGKDQNARLIVKLPNTGVSCCPSNSRVPW
jgi:quaternary ammonium compound-resistance protein SugE